MVIAKDKNEMLFLGELSFQFSWDLPRRFTVDACAIGYAIEVDFRVASRISDMLRVATNLLRRLNSGDAKLWDFFLVSLICENIPREPELIRVGDAGEAAQGK